MSSELIFEGGAHRRPLEISRHRRARGMRLRVDPRNGAVRLTLPPRISERRAKSWAAQQRRWVEEQLEKLPQPRPIKAGATIPFRGEELRIEWHADYSRLPRRIETALRIGGEESELSNRVIRWLKEEARAHLQSATDLYAAKAGVEVEKVSIGDARTRWGSCSSSGRIRYNWRLVMAPPAVLESVAAHEIAHRLHMDHSPRFHAAVARLFGREPGPENCWLRDHGTALYWVGCSS